jgi:gas vesicle protein
MTNTNKFWKGILFGALAGGALSLLDKQTRIAMNANCRKASSSISYMIKHPKEVTEQVIEVANKIRVTVEDVSEDIHYLTEKIEEIREVTPQVVEIVKETKEAFTNKGHDSEQQNGRSLDHQMETESLYGKRNLQ